VAAGRRRVLTGAAAVLVLAALAAPNETAQVTPAGLLRVPVEALVGVVVLLLTPGRVRRFAAALAGALLGLVTVVNVVDLGFLEAFDPPVRPPSSTGCCSTTPTASSRARPAPPGPGRAPWPPPSSPSRCPSR
jgi:hypothetical protein